MYSFDKRIMRKRLYGMILYYKAFSHLFCFDVVYKEKEE